MDQAVFLKAQILERTFKESQEKIDFLEQQIIELDKFKQSIKAISDSKGKEIISPLGKGVHAKTSLVDDDFFVEVGSGVVVKKTPAQLINTIDSQISQLHDARAHVSGELEIARHSLISLLEEIETNQKN